MKPRKRGATPHRSATPRRPAKGAGAIQRGASVQKTYWFHRLESYRNHHQQVARESLKKMFRAPLSTLMTMLVIAIALALPTGLLVALGNARSVAQGWDSGAQISLYMKAEVTDEDARQFAAELGEHPSVARTEFISKAQALQEFKSLSGLGELLEDATDNPLPAVIVVYPSDTDLSKGNALREELETRPLVETAQLDAQWVQRLHAILELGERVIWSLTWGLSLAVLLVVFNTIRLMIENRRDEIVIIKMVGGTDAFVRRPFLYTGLWYGIGGGVIAFVITESALIWVKSPVNRLAELYQSDFVLNGLGFPAALMLLVGSGMLGLFGAWLAVSKHLRSIEPT